MNAPVDPPVLLLPLRVPLEVGDAPEPLCDPLEVPAPPAFVPLEAPEPVLVPWTELLHEAAATTRGTMDARR
jgi:hypothetical protein